METNKRYIKCIDNDDCPQLKKHGIYEVVKETDSFLYVNDGDDGAYNKSRFVESKYSSKDEELTARTIKIIEQGGSILLKGDSKWYMGGWTNIAAGPDQAQWSHRNFALEMFNLKWAFAIAKLYNCKVVVYYPHGKKRQVSCF